MVDIGADLAANYHALVKERGITYAELAEQMSRENTKGHALVASWARDEALAQIKRAEEERAKRVIPTAPPGNPTPPVTRTAEQIHRRR